MQPSHQSLTVSQNTDQRTNEIKIWKTVEKIHTTKNCFLKDKIYKPLIRLINKREDSVHKIRNERRDLITDTTEIHKIIRDYCEDKPTNWVTEK